MLARYFHKLVHLQLNKRAVTSLEYAMVAMVVAVASVGAFTGGHTTAASALMQVASVK